VWTDRYERKLHWLLFEYEVITDEKKENVQQGITASAGGVAKSLPVHESAEQGIKKIQDIIDPLLHDFQVTKLLKKLLRTRGCTENAQVGASCRERERIGHVPLGEFSSRSLVDSYHLLIEITHPGKFHFLIMG